MTDAISDGMSLGLLKPFMCVSPVKYTKQQDRLRNMRRKKGCPD